MKLFDELSDENFEMYAVRNYYNPACIDPEEFYEDLKRFKYVKRLITRYKEGNKPSVNLLLNHLVVIFNVFGIQSGLRMLEFKIREEDFSILKPFFIYLQIVENTEYTGITMDQTIVEELRNI